MSLSPQVWNLPLLPSSTDSFTSVLISDLVLYLDHQDPGLRGAAVRLVFRVLRGASVESGGRLARWFQTSDRDQAELLALLTDLVEDESSIVVRQVLSGALLALPELVQCEESREVVGLLERLGGLASNKYWLVRLELCHLLSATDSLAASYTWPSWERSRLDSLIKMLSDEDSRVSLLVTYNSPLSLVEALILKILLACLCGISQQHITISHIVNLRQDLEFEMTSLLSQ